MNVDNPYAPSAAALEAPAPPTQEELTRRRYLKHETSLKSAGTLFLIAGAFWIFVFIGTAALAVVRVTNGKNDSFGKILIMLLLFAAMAALLLWFASGLRNLKKEVRSSVIILSCVSLFGFPIGTLISAWIIYLAASQKGKFIFSDEYKRIIAATPHIKYKSSEEILVLLFILMTFILPVVLFAVYGKN